MTSAGAVGVVDGVATAEWADVVGTGIVLDGFTGASSSSLLSVTGLYRTSLIVGVELCFAKALPPV